ncbi:MAG: VWA domain-containing protein [Saprospiraceae bacterium]|nr:VWA domain-containing protein [Pyrinomonadaceae bacterium]
MKNILLSVFVALFIFSVNASAQTPTPPVLQPEDDVVKITSELVQLDIIVTDKEGNQITDLTAKDFEIRQDGKPQIITNLSYVGLASPDLKKDQLDKINTKSPRKALRESGRIVTFLVDDGNCLATQFSMLDARKALENFVSSEMLPNDLVAVYQTRSGSSAMQHYTSDKSQLLRIAAKIRWYPSSLSCVVYSSGDFIPSLGQQGRTGGEPENDSQLFGTFGLMRYVVRGLERLPGRKIIFLLSNGIPVRDRSGSFNSGFDGLRDITDIANRAAVSFHTINLSGTNDAFVGADRNVSAGNVGRLREELDRESRNARDGLYYLAGETGGEFYQGANFLSGIQKALSLEKGYYLVAYEPDKDTFKSKKFNKIEVVMKRPGLRVISRAGFMGTTDESVKLSKRTGDSELYEAIAAPLPRAGLNLQLTAFFGNSLAEGNFVRSMIHLKGSDISFVDDLGGGRKAVFDVVAVTLNEKNEVVDEFTRSHTIKIDTATATLITQNGLIYTTDIKVKKAGTYNFRVAVRDVSNGMIGTAGRLIDIPDLKKGRISVSGLSLTRTEPDGSFAVPAATNANNAISLATSQAAPAIRRFTRDTILGYAYTVYNAQPDKTTGQPKLLLQVNLYRDGKIIAEGKPKPIELKPQTAWSQISERGSIRLSSGVAPGDYTLEIIVTDQMVSEKKAISSQSLDFEVIE